MSTLIKDPVLLFRLLLVGEKPLPQYPVVDREIDPGTVVLVAYTASRFDPFENQPKGRRTEPVEKKPTRVSFNIQYAIVLADSVFSSAPNEEDDGSVDNANDLESDTSVKNKKRSSSSKGRRSSRA